MQKMSFGKKFYLEKLMMKGEKDKTMIYYDKKQYL